MIEDYFDAIKKDEILLDTFYVDNHQPGSFILDEKKLRTQILSLLQMYSQNLYDFIRKKKKNRNTTKATKRLKKSLGIIQILTETNLLRPSNSLINCTDEKNKTLFKYDRSAKSKWPSRAH